MWIHDEIKRTLELIWAGSIHQLKNIGQLPYEKAVQIAAYLWWNSCCNTNDVWYVSCRGLLWLIPEEWVMQNLDEVLSHMEIDWSDDFEYANLCAAFFHVPLILERLVSAGEKMGTTSDVLEFAEEYRSRLPEGCLEYYVKTMELFQFHKKEFFD